MTLPLTITFCLWKIGNYRTTKGCTKTLTKTKTYLIYNLTNYKLPQRLTIIVNAQANECNKRKLRSCQLNLNGITLFLRIDFCPFGITAKADASGVDLKVATISSAYGVFALSHANLANLTKVYTNNYFLYHG